MRAPFDLKISTRILQIHTKNSLEADFRFSALNFFYSPVRLRKITKSQEILADSPGFGQVSKRLDRFWVSGPLRPLETPNHHQTSSTCSYHEYYRFWAHEAICHTLGMLFHGFCDGVRATSMATSRRPARRPARKSLRFSSPETAPLPVCWHHYCNRLEWSRGESP